jgi:hypothetical protein
MRPALSLSCYQDHKWLARRARWRRRAEPQPILVSSSKPNAGSKKKERHAEVRSGTLRFKSGLREQFTAERNSFSMWSDWEWPLKIQETVL